MTFTILVESFLVIITPLSEPKFFQKYIKYTLFIPKLPLEVRDHEIYNFLSPYTTDNTYQVWLKLAY